MLSSKLKNKPPLRKRSFSFDAIGTIWHIEIEQPILAVKLTRLKDLINKRTEQFDKNYSRFRSNSLVMTMAEKPGRYRLPSDAEPMFDLYAQLYELSGGLMTPLIGQMMSDSGYDASYSLKPKELTAPPAWDETIDYKFPFLLIKQPVLIDLGAAGKGYLVDIIAALIEAVGITSFSINAGGDILNHQVSEKLSRIGLENPRALDEVIGVAYVNNKSLCGSAGNRRTWSEFHHIINPKTKVSPKHILATWAVADTTLLADGLTTALFFTEPHVLAKHYNFEYALVKSDLTLEHSANFPAEFFNEVRKTVIES